MTALTRGLEPKARCSNEEGSGSVIALVLHMSLREIVAISLPRPRTVEWFGSMKSSRVFLVSVKHRKSRLFSVMNSLSKRPLLFREQVQAYKLFLNSTTSLYTKYQDTHE